VATLLLVGDGPDEEAMRRRCETEGLDNVVFAGYRQRKDLPLYYAAADVFVFPTLGDPYGLVVDEAMACGLPVVSTRAAGEIHRRVTNGTTGFVVPAGDPHSLSARMALLAGDPQLRLTLGRRAARRVAWQSPDVWAQQFERVVAEILAV
jgi:glycosyltransferase involved in cell wall biosynthesis